MVTSTQMNTRGRVSSRYLDCMLRKAGLTNQENNMGTYSLQEQLEQTYDN